MLFYVVNSTSLQNLQQSILRSLTGDVDGGGKDFAQALKQDQLQEIVEANRSASHGQNRIASVER